MDPLTQGVLGAALPQAVRRKSHVGVAGALGFLAGMSADLDVLIRSSSDSLMFLEYHRQFTHSLIFIPVGGLLCAFFLHWILGRRSNITYLQTWLFCTLGYATHAVLDTATSYGTMLFWPFSNERFSWNIVSVIDPLFTLPLLILAIVSGLRRNPVFARIGLAWAGLYLVTAFTQHNAALNMAKQIAADRGHAPIRLDVKPGFGNILVWKTIYETPQRFYIDAVRTGFTPRVFPGSSIPKLNLARDLPWLDPDSQQSKDIGRFDWFSKGYLAQDSQRPLRIMDVRYSLVPNEIAGLWSIELSRDAGRAEHARFRTHRENINSSFDKLWQMAFGK
ncbi:MAG: inner membrane protein [Alphaproteobacteria bacterium]|jgi:inner membrane protein